MAGERELAEIQSPLLRRSEPAWYKEPPAAAPSESLDPELLQTLLFMGRVEDHTSAYSLFSYLNPKLQEDIEFAGEAATWATQEWWHGQQIWSLLRHFEPSMDRARDRVQQASTLSLWHKFKQRLIAELGPMTLGPETMAGIVAVRGFYNELTTRAGYNLLRELADHPDLAILKPIADEESLHAANYRKRAEEILDGSRRAQSVARFVVKHNVMIVGEDYRGTSEADAVIRTLFGNSRAAGVAASVDEALSTLPGLQGLNILQARVSQAL